MNTTDKPEQTFYLIQLQDDKIGVYTPESELLSKKVALQRLIEGEWDHSPLVRVIEITVGELSRDVTEDFMREIYGHLLEDGKNCPDWLFDAMCKCLDDAAPDELADAAESESYFSPSREWGTLNKRQQGI